LERLPDLAAEMVRLKFDVIIARGLAAAKTTKDATTTIPIVTVASDPVGGRTRCELGAPRREHHRVGSHLSRFK